MTQGTRLPRADKERNRVRLTQAAAHAIQRDGLNVSMRAIAREAGMGIATAYRHFPTKDALVEAVLAAQVERCTSAIRAAPHEPDAWTALCAVIDWFAELQVTSPGLLRVLLDGPASNASFALPRREHAAALDLLVARARSSASLRQNVSSDDVRVGMMAMTAFTGGTSRSAPNAVEALKGILIYGISAAR